MSLHFDLRKRVPTLAKSLGLRLVAAPLARAVALRGGFNHWIDRMSETERRIVVRALGGLLALVLFAIAVSAWNTSLAGAKSIWRTFQGVVAVRPREPSRRTGRRSQQPVKSTVRQSRGSRGATPHPQRTSCLSSGGRSPSRSRRGDARCRRLPTTGLPNRPPGETEPPSGGAQYVQPSPATGGSSPPEPSEIVGSTSPTGPTDGAVGGGSVDDGEAEH